MLSFNINRPENYGLPHSLGAEKTAKSETISYGRITLSRETEVIGRINTLVKHVFKEIKNSFEGVIKNLTSPNHYVGMRRSLARVRQLSITLFKKLGEGAKKTGEALSQNHVVRKMKDSLDYLQNCDFSFVRASVDPFLKEELAQVGDLISFYLDFEKNEEKMKPEEGFNMALLLLKRIAELQVSPQGYPVRNAMSAEVLTKHVVAHPLPANCILPIPCFNQEDQPVVVNYGLGRQLTLGSTKIPVFVFVPNAESDKKLFSPLLIFRGTRCSMENEEDIRSVIENLNKVGPARGVYNEFKDTLKQMFKHWFPSMEKPLFRVMGYSQGAVLGQRACVDFYPYIDKRALNGSIFLNSPAVEKDYIQAWESIKKEDRPYVTNILVTRDLVSKRGNKFIGDVYELDSLKKLGFLQAHLGCKFINKSIFIYQVDNDKEAESYSRQLINQVMSSGMIETLYKFMVKHVPKVKPVPVDPTHVKEMTKTTQLPHFTSNRS